MSRATRDAAAAAEIHFGQNTYTTRRATLFAQRNADRVTSLGAFVAPNFASIRIYSQLRDLGLKVGRARANIALLPCSLTRLGITLQGMNINWEVFRPLCNLQELRIFGLDCILWDKVELDNSFATALPLLRVLHVDARPCDNAALWTSTKVAMPHLVELSVFCLKKVHLDLHSLSGLKKISLVHCATCDVSRASSTMTQYDCSIKQGMLTNLRSMILHGGLHMRDGSDCWHDCSILCVLTPITWVGAQPKIRHFRQMTDCWYNGVSVGYASASCTSFGHAVPSEDTPNVMPD